MTSFLFRNAIYQSAKKIIIVGGCGDTGFEKARYPGSRDAEVV